MNNIFLEYDNRTDAKRIKKLYSLIYDMSLLVASNIKYNIAIKDISNIIDVLKELDFYNQEDIERVHKFINDAIASSSQKSQVAAQIDEANKFLRLDQTSEHENFTKTRAIKKSIHFINHLLEHKKSNEYIAKALSKKYAKELEESGLNDFTRSDIHRELKKIKHYN